MYINQINIYMKLSSIQLSLVLRTIIWLKNLKQSELYMDLQPLYNSHI